MASGWQAGDVTKRAFDIVAASTGLVIAAPLMAAVALGVLATSGRPVLFRQDRAGRNGRVFQIVKFRTMTEQHGPDGALLPDHQRLTRVGRFLRSTTLDELPELWNVLKGDMSLVGPRPLHAHYVDRYSGHHRRRLDVRPGLTGWAVVQGRNRLSWEKRFDLDVWYVDHRGFLLDLKILAMTVWLILRGKGVTAPGHATMSEYGVEE